jgi:hypothetical protein
LEQNREFIKFNGIRLFDLPFISHIISNVHHKIKATKTPKTIIPRLPTLKLVIKKYEDTFVLKPFIRMDPGELVIFAAQIATGKTTLLLQTALEVSKRGRVLFISPNREFLPENNYYFSEISRLYKSYENTYENIIFHSSIDILERSLSNINFIFLDEIESMHIPSSILGPRPLQTSIFERQLVFKNFLVDLSSLLKSTGKTALVSVTTRRVGLSVDGEDRIPNAVNIPIPLAFKHIADKIYTLHDGKLYMIKGRESCLQDILKKLKKG